jgi:hypothetical protein
VAARAGHDRNGEGIKAADTAAQASIRSPSLPIPSSLVTTA